MPSVSTLDHTSGEALHVEGLDSPLTSELQLCALQLEVVEERVLHDGLGLRVLAAGQAALAVVRARLLGGAEAEDTANCLQKRLVALEAGTL